MARLVRLALAALAGLALAACGTPGIGGLGSGDGVRLATRAAPSDGRWLAVQFHAHSRHSDDGRIEVKEVLRLARSQGLDALALSDHDTKTQFADPDFQSSEDLALIHSYEWTSQAGHAGVHGTRNEDVVSWQDPKEKLYEHAAAHQEVLILHHPNFPRGASWKGGWDDRATAVEVWNSFYLLPGKGEPIGDPIVNPTTHEHGVEHDAIRRTQDLGDYLANELAIRWWNGLLEEGKRVPITAASDFHRWPQTLASPCTLVWARENTESAILEALRAGRSQGVQAPRKMRIDLEAVAAGGERLAMVGDTVAGAGPLELRATVTGGRNQHLTLHTKAGALARVRVPADPWTYEFALDAQAGKPDFVWARLETSLWHGILTALTSPIYVNL